MTHICVGNLTNIGLDNGLSPGRRQVIIWTNAGILSIGPPGTNFSEMLIEIHTFSFKKIHLKMSSGKWRPFCLGLNVLKWYEGTYCPQWLIACQPTLVFGWLIDSGQHQSLFSLLTLLTHWGRDKWTPFRGQHFQMRFLEWKCLNSE